MTNVNIVKISDFSTENYCRFREIVSDDKRNRIDKYILVDDYKRSLLGDVLARSMLSKMIGIGARALDIRIDDSGKPYVWGQANTFFNISHSGEYVACIVSDFPCGIDIEHATEGGIDIAKRFFNKIECEYIFEGPKEVQSERFCEIWTAKEAYAKYTGTGLRTGFINFEIVCRENNLYICCGRYEKRVYVRRIDAGYFLSYITDDSFVERIERDCEALLYL